MYVCGVTVYDHCHIGHARANVVFDVIYRYFCHLGLDVTYVRNYTDIDDKIINRANREGVTYDVISERFIKEFDRDMERLGLKLPTCQPKVPSISVKSSPWRRRSSTGALLIRRGVTSTFAWRNSTHT